MRRILCAVACLILLVTAAMAQSDRGTITGTITDPTGAMVPNASIEAKNMQTGVTYKVASSDTGNYTLAQLPVGVYQITAAANGFKQFIRTGITVSTAQTLRVDIKLQVGSIQEVVTVNADAPLLKTESGEMSQVVTSTQLDQLPILNISTFGIRDSFSGLNLLPGAGEITAPGSLFNTVRVNGIPGGTESVRIDGQDATETAWSAAYNMAMPGTDAMEETAIQTSNYSAEFGQAGGAVFNMTMKSGTNHFHGSAYEYMRNDALDASQPYTHYTPVDKRHDYGFTIGGPVDIPHVYDGHDKTFFFFSFEQNRESLTTNSVMTMPTTAYRNGDFSSLLNGQVIGTDAIGRPIYNGEIYNPATTRTAIGTYGPYASKAVTIRDPFMGCDGLHMNVMCTTGPNAIAMDPVALKLQSAMPQPINGLPTNNYDVSYPYAPLTTIPSIKIDHNINDKLKISGSWSMTDIYQPFMDGLQQPVTTERDLWETTHTARINLDYTITPTMLLHLGGGYMGFSFSDPVPDFQGYNVLQNLGLPGTYSNIPPTITGLTGWNGSGMGTNPMMGVNMGPNAQQHQWSEKPTGTGTLTWVKGNHTYKFGAEFRADSFPSLAISPSNGQFNFSPAQTALPYLNATTLGTGDIGLGYASFLLGDVNTGSIGQMGDFHLGKHAFAFFAQDSWKVTPKLTIDYGLRYDYETYLQNSGMLPAFGFNTPNPQYGGLLGAAVFEGYGPGKCNCDFASNYPYDFGPRLGVAYQITPKTVFRGGIGVSYAQTADLEMASLRFGSNDPYGPATTYGMPISQLQSGPPLVPIWPNFNPSQIPGAFPGTSPMAGAFDPHAGYPPRLLMWSLGIQRELSKNMALEISYVGNRGAWWNSDGVLTDPNRVTSAILSAHNFDPTLANTTDDAVLNEQFSQLTAAQAAHYNLKAPYPGFQGTVSQALRPYPQVGGVTINWAPLGDTWYDALQVKFTKRYSHGLSMTASYSFQKEEVVGTESQDPAFQVAAPIINLDNLRANKTISGLSIPQRLVVTANYITPKLNLYKPLSLLMRDWQFGAFLTYQSGFPIMAPQAANNPYNPAQLLSMSGSDVRAFGNAGYQIRVPGQPLYLTDINSHYNPNTTFVLNPAAWATPGPGQYGGVPYYNDYRYRWLPSENLSLERIFTMREGMSLSLRVELQNVFNRTYIPNPFGGMILPQQTTASGLAYSGFGYSNAINAGGERTAQIVARFNF